MEAVKQKSWFGRNWPWLLPVGGCLTVILLLVFGVGAIFFGASKVFKSAEPYEYAINLAENNSKVKQLIGESIETEGMIKGNISYSNDDGEANFKIPIKGEKGEGHIVVAAKKINGEWIYEKLYVVIKANQEEINLLNKALEGV